MRRSASALGSLAAILALAGCGDDRPVGEPSESALPWINEKAETEAADQPDVAAAEPAVQAGPGTIPEAMQGRWGLVPADCVSDRGDAKGLLEIGPSTLKFYESVGKLGAVEERSESRIRADFAFSGEGMSWEHEVLLDVQDGGEALVRREFGADAAPGAFTYTRCS